MDNGTGCPRGTIQNRGPAWLNPKLEIVQDRNPNWLTNIQTTLDSKPDRVSFDHTDPAIDFRDGARLANQRTRPTMMAQLGKCQDPLGGHS